MAGGLDDAHARQEAELDRLLGERKRSRYDRLRRNDGGDGRHQNERIMEPGWSQLVEGIVDRASVSHQQAALAKIIQDDARQRHREPGEPDRETAEMPHIGIEGFAAGHRKEDRADNGQGGRPGMDEIADGVGRREGHEDGRVHRDAAQAEQRNGDEPDKHDGPEYPADEGCAQALNQEEPDEDRRRQRRHQRLQVRRIDLKPFQRTQHGNRRRYCAVPVKQSRSDQPENDQAAAPSRRLGALWTDERQQSQNAALAVVVGAHDQNGIFDRNDQKQRPKDERDDAENVVWRRRAAGRRSLHCNLKRIEIAGADIAEDDAERGYGDRSLGGGKFRRIRRGFHNLLPPTIASNAPGFKRRRGHAALSLYSAWKRRNRDAGRAIRR